MLARRIIPCLDVKEGRVVKGTQFVNLRDAGDPVELAAFYGREGADELVFLDISASSEGRKTTIEMVRRVAERVFIPFTVGGGIGSVEDIECLLQAGADKVSLNTAAINNPDLVKDAAAVFGSQCVVVAIDARKADSGWMVYTHGGGEKTDLSAVKWAARAAELGAGEILLTSMDADGETTGYDIPLTRAVAEAINIPVIASGGAGELAHFARVFKDAKADAALAASVFHYRRFSIKEVKTYLSDRGIEVRHI